MYLRLVPNFPSSCLTFTSAWSSVIQHCTQLFHYLLTVCNSYGQITYPVSISIVSYVEFIELVIKL